MEDDMNYGEIIERLAREAERKTITIEELNKKIEELEKELADLKGQQN